MPRGNVDYSKGLIYKICCKDPNVLEIYIGSTTNFRGRKREHKSSCNNPNCDAYNDYKYKFIREHGGWDNWELIEIEKYDAKDKRDLERREEELRKQLGAKLNMRRSYSTIEEQKQIDYERHKTKMENDEEYRNEYKRKQKERYDIKKKDPEWINKVRERENQGYHRRMENSEYKELYIEKSKKRFNRFYNEKKKDPEWVKRKNEKERKAYHRRKLTQNQQQ